MALPLHDEFLETPAEAAEQTTPPPRWGRLLLLLALLGLFLAALVIALLGRPTTHLAPTATTPRPAPTAAIAGVAPPALPVVERFGVTAAKGGAPRVYWAVAGADLVELAGRQAPPIGSISLTLAQPTRLLLLAANGGGIVSQLLPLMPPPLRPATQVLPPLVLHPPAVRRFAAARDPQSGSWILSWQTAGADLTLLNGRPVRSTGAEPVRPGAAPAYTVQADNVAGRAVSTVHIPAEPAAISLRATLTLPTITRFTIIHPHAGQPYALSWQTSNASSVTLNGRPVASQGERSLPAPIRGARYNLLAANRDGQVQSQVEVIVE